MEVVSRELEEAREEGGRVRVESEEKGERVREAEGQLRELRDTLLEKESLVNNREQVRLYIICISTRLNCVHVMCVCVHMCM